MSQVTRVAVLGAAGRMGSEACRAIEADPGLELVARVGRGDPPSMLLDAGAEVAVDFTTPDAVRDNIRFCLDHGIHAVVGTSGLKTRDLDDIGAWARAAEANAFVAPNFSVGAVLMMSFAAQAARHFERAEIVERHHDRKLDAPSATALRTAALMNESREEPWPDPPTTIDALGGSRGGDTGGVRVHSLRLPGSVAHQEVLLGAPGETLVIRHDTVDRSAFMPGMLLAVKRVASLPGLTIGLEPLLGL
jgi:4-hydroxy-tetrahydrodipicolinate reductase